MLITKASSTRIPAARRCPAAAGPRATCPAAPSISRPHTIIARQPRFSSIKRYSSDTGAEGDDQLVSKEGKILQGKQHLDEAPQLQQAAGESPGTAGAMSEDKRGSLPEQGGAPEGDRAAAGQAYQPTGEEGSAVASPEAGEKQLSSEGRKDAGQVASREERQQEDRTPLQD